MSNRFKYSNHGIARFENFAENAPIQNFPYVSIGPMLASNEWTITLWRDSNNDDLIIPGFHHAPRFLVFGPFGYPKALNCRVLFNISNQDSSQIYQKEDKFVLNYENFPFGPTMPISKLAEPQFGFLDNGALNVEYGIQIESILEKDGIWKFNFYDLIFNCDEKLDLITFQDMTFDYGFSLLHCPEQLLFFHSPYFKNNYCGYQAIRIPKSMNFRDFHTFLQVAHGVRWELLVKDLSNITLIAHHYNMWNVIRYCEAQLMQHKNLVRFRFDFRRTMKEVSFAIQYDMRHYLTCLLKTEHCSNRLEFSKWILENLELESLSSEVMKMLAKKIFES